MEKRKVLSFLLGAVLAASALPVHAHGVWFAPRLDQTQLVLGEGYKDNAYDPKSVTSLTGYNAVYQKRPLSAINGGNHITIQPAEDISVAVVHFDYGYWTKGADGKIHHAAMTEVPGATAGTHAIKYAVSYLKPVKATKPVPGLPYQIVPLKDPSLLSVGDMLPIQVLHNGVPMPEAEIFPDVINHHTITIKTDKHGRTMVPVANGSTNVIGLELVQKHLRPDGKATQDKIFSSLSFIIYPEEED